MTYQCPNCGISFDATELQQPAGVGGGSYCPKCQSHVRLKFPYGRWVAVISLFLAIAILRLFRVTSIPWLILGTILLWIPISLYLNVYSFRYKAPTLIKWKERRRSFFEWLYERDSTPRLFDKRNP